MCLPGMKPSFHMYPRHTVNLHNEKKLVGYKWNKKCIFFALDKSPGSD